MREEIANWQTQAETDLKSAIHSLDAGDYYVVAFLCQQAVEKSLKALIMLKTKQKNIEGHSLIQLGKIINIPEKYYPFLRELSPHYIISRYPDAANGTPADIYDRKISEKLIEISKRTMEWTKKQLKQQENLQKK